MSKLQLALLLAIIFIFSNIVEAQKSSQWWILLQVHERGVSLPKLNGPYPSEELCRMAGKTIDRHDRRFWAQAEREQADAAERERLRAERAEHAQALADARRQGKTELVTGVGATVGSSTRWRWNAKANEWEPDTWLNGTTITYIGLPRPYAISGCIETDAAGKLLIVEAQR